MRKTLIVAQSEFTTLVKTKAFLISLILMPIVMGGSIMLVRATKDATDSKDRTFAVVDYTGTIAEPLKAIAGLYNSSTPSAIDGILPRKGPRFIPIEIKPDGRSADELRLDLSNRVRKEELFAFIELPAKILDPAANTPILYYSDHPSYNALPQWIRATVNAVVLNERFKQASVDRGLVVRLTKQAPIDERGLFETAAGGGVKPAEEVSVARAIGVPLAALVLMYMTIMTSAPQLLNSVIEEKISRISEVLVGSITPFTLMMGKLIGGAAASTLLSIIYIGGGLAVAQVLGRLCERGYAGNRRMVPALPRFVALHLWRAVRGDRCRVQRSEGFAEHDDAGDAAGHDPGLHGRVGDARTRRDAGDRVVARADRRAIPDAPSHLASTRPADVADRALGAADDGDRAGGGVGGGKNLSHGPPHAG